MTEVSKITPAPFFSCFICAAGIAVVWSLIGSAIAYHQGDFPGFLREWQVLQGPFLIGMGAWLVLIARSGAFQQRLCRISAEPGKIQQSYLSGSTRVAIIMIVGTAGTASLIGLGFNGTGAVLLYYWATTGLICVAAGIVTAHTINLILAIRSFEKIEIVTFKYSPAQTPELREFIGYFTSFTLLLSVGYAAAFYATMTGNWTGDRLYVESVQWFWPAIYVPVCTVALIYPHVVMHRLIQKTKERALVTYQTEIDGLLRRYQGLKNEEVERINNLAALFDRINATPNYVLDIGIAARIALPLICNIAILFAKPMLGQS